MKRETKFRAIDEFSDDFIYAPAFFVDSDNNQGYVIWGTSDYHYVKKETVGEYIGKKDIKGNEIYEGDYLVDRFPINDEDLSEGYNESLLPVVWCNEKLCWCVDVTFAKNGTRLEPIHSYFGSNIEVKGNIHQK